MIITKYVKYPILAISLLAFSSCNQGKIDELEHEVSKLRKENDALKSHIEELEDVISNYKSYSARYSDRQNQREWHQQNAQQHLREAEFWRQNGEEFLYESSVRNAQQDLDMMP